MSSKQFNIELPAADVMRIKKDCLKLGVSLKDYTAMAFREFRNNRIDDLRGRFGSKKTVGRKVTL
jgi:hypothetical protein